MTQSTETLTARRDRLLGENTPLFMMLRSFTYLGWWNERRNEFYVGLYRARAGGCLWSRLETLSEEDLELTLSINLKACFRLLKVALPSLRQSEHGRFLVTSSVTGPKVAMPGAVHYGAAKAGVNAFVRGAALELASDGITVNAVEPGYIQKPDGFLADPAQRSRIEQYIPLGWLGDPDDIAWADGLSRQRRS